MKLGFPPAVADWVHDVCTGRGVATTPSAVRVSAAALVVVLVGTMSYLGASLAVANVELADRLNGHIAVVSQGRPLELALLEQGRVSEDAVLAANAPLALAGHQRQFAEQAERVDARADRLLNEARDPLAREALARFRAEHRAEATRSQAGLAALAGSSGGERARIAGELVADHRRLADRLHAVLDVLAGQASREGAAACERSAHELRSVAAFTLAVSILLTLAALAFLRWWSSSAAAPPSAVAAPIPIDRARSARVPAKPARGSAARPTASGRVRRSA